jgi:hypothetical protein
MNLKKYIKGGLNSDSNPTIMADGDYLNALNVRTQIGDDGLAGIVRPVSGNEKLATIADDWSNILHVSTQDVKHMCVDEVNGYAYAFVSGIVNKPSPQTDILQKIERVDLKDGTVTTILNVNRIDDKWEPSTDTSYLWEDLVQAKVVGDTLIWINRDGYQFSLNVKAYLNATPGEPGFLSLNVDRRDISLIKAPPAFNLDVTKLEDALYTGVNYIKDSIFQFAYRYVYAGGEQSVVSPWSKEVALNIETDDYNYIKIGIPIKEVIPSSIMYIDILSKNNVTTAINLIKRFSALDEDFVETILNHNAGVSQITYDFYNDNVYEAVDAAYFFKQFDAVPVESYSIEVAKDRVFLANNTEGYDAPDYVDISINASTQEPTGSRDIEYSLQTYDNVDIYDNVASTNIVDEYYYWRNIMYIDGIDESGYYYVNGDIDGVGGSTITDNGISLGAIDPLYPHVCEINSNPGTLDFLLDTTIIPGCEIYVTGFTNSANNGYYVVEEVAADDTLLVVKSDGVLPANEGSGAAVSITLLSSFYGTTSGDVSNVPTPVDNAYTELVYLGTDPYGTPTGNYFIHRSFGSYPYAESYSFGGMSLVASGSDVTITGLPTSQTRTFKSSSRYNVGVQFYDFAMRKCGVVTKTRNQDFELVDITASIPDRGYSSTNLQTLISWGLANPAPTQIPEWAKYYSIVRTDNLDTRYFIQGKTKDIATGEELSYATKNSTTGEYTISATKLTHDDTVVGISLDLETMLNDGFGYIYEEVNGDVVKLYKDSGEKYTLKVIGQQGRYIILEPKDIGNLTGELWIYEIRRPYKQSGSEPFYEGSIYEINDWGKSTRSYSVTTGSLFGDTFISADKEYMNLREDFRNFWTRNLGRACFIDNIGQIYKPTGIRWSNTFVSGSQINGLSSFDAIDYKDAPIELGPINKLQITSKAQSEGNVMIAIGQNYTASMYLGETSVVDNAGQSLLSTSGAVIGTINVLKGRFGTTLPSSVVEYDGSVYWADILNECIVRYSGNGLFAISDVGMRNFFRSYFKAKKADVDEYNIVQSPYIYGGYNPATDEYILSFSPVTQAQSQYPDTSANRHSDIRNMYKTGTLAKSVAFSLAQERWTTFYSHGGPYIHFGGRMYSFVKSVYPVGPFDPTPQFSGGLFIYNKDSAVNVFGGVNCSSFISVPVNDAPSTTKVFNALAIEGTTAPNTTYVETFIPNSQITNMVSSDYVNREDVLYVDILRDRVSPNAFGTADEKMFTGDKMRGQHANVSLIWNNAVNFDVRFLNINVRDSIGHNKISQ